MKIFNIKKDVRQFKKTKIEIVHIKQKIDNKFPLFISITNSIFIIIKWLIIVGTVLVLIYYCSIMLPAKIHQQKINDGYVNCTEECPEFIKIQHEEYIGYNLTEILYLNRLDNENPLNIKQKKLRNDCLMDCEEKYEGFTWHLFIPQNK